jgi:predicted TIM-barrel fold metal-dependent hydrolase
MQSIEFVDSNCMIGKRTAPALPEPKDTSEVKSILLASGIKRALACHSRSVEYHPLEGNAKICEETEKDDFFMPVWVVMPGHTGEFPAGKKLEDLLCINNVKALKAAPGALNYSLSAWSMGEVYETAQKVNLPLLIDFEQIELDALNDVLGRYPSLNIILTATGYRNGRYIYPLMKLHKNLHLEISMYKNHMCIEHLCKAFGSKRIIYGSGMPKYSPGCAKAMVLNADIPEAEKRNIASRNILRLTGGNYG